MIGGVCRCVSSVTRHICKVIHQGAARGGPVMLSTLDMPVMLCPIMATPWYVSFEKCTALTLLVD